MFCGSPVDYELLWFHSHLTGFPEYRGSYLIKCRNLLVEDQAVLTGNVNADEAVVAGQVNGEVNVAVLRIKDTGVFDGIIKANGVEVDNGAVLKARFRKKKR